MMCVRSNVHSWRSTKRSGTHYSCHVTSAAVVQKIKDLLNPNGPPLKVRESKHKGVWVDGLVQEYVTSEAEVGAAKLPVV